jgi:hypothetical protein
MIHITYFPSTNDSLSSGHIFFEIFTVFIFSHLIPNIKPIWNKEWNLSKIISKESFLNFTAPPLKNYDKIIIINKFHKWGSLSFQDFLDIKQTINEASEKYDTILIQLQNVCAIHPDVLHSWYINKSLKDNIFVNNARPLLKNMYYFDHNSKPINAIAIHIRRGDLLERLYSAGFTIEYYKNIIININKVLDIPIYIYCESDNNKGTTRPLANYSNKYNNDYIELTKLKNVQIKLGNYHNFSEQFNELTRCKYLILSPSGFSLWAAFISQGKILYDQKCVDFRPNLFRNAHIIPNFFQYNNPDEILNELN